MNHNIDGQFELLSHLLGEGSSEQTTTHSGQARRKDESASSIDESAQIAPGRAHIESSSVIETRPDTGRELRKGTPEIIFAETKETTQIVSMARTLLAGTKRAIISRLRAESVEPLQKAFQDDTVCFHEASRVMTIYSPDYERKNTGGHVGVISAGTSDIPVAEEAALIAQEMGCRITYIYDVGVAGLHRLIGPLRELIASDVDVIIVAAGMDGALPSVVTGLVPVPVIGLPTSIGYGLGGKGLAAMLSMLQTCAPGLTVVNIDNGVGAGITAALIANRVARAREHQSQ